MDQAGIPTAGNDARHAAVHGGLGHPRLWLFDRVRDLLVDTGLPPDAPVVDLLLRHVEGDDPILSAAVVAAIAIGLDLATVMVLRRAHCGEVSATEVAALVEAAHGQAEALSARLGGGASELHAYGVTLADGDRVLSAPAAPDAAALARLIERLGAATTTMLAANARLSVELAHVAVETGRLRDNLRTAELAAVTDPLTGVLNRRGAFRRLEAAQAHARGAAEALSVAMIDIDHFKRVNDSFGHAMGDEVLRYVAQHLAAAAGADGHVGRIGGEEFLMVLPATGLGAATGRIDRARAALAGRIIRRGDDGTSLGRVSFSAGTALDADGDTPDALIARADAGLYSAKRMGRDRVVPST